ncbi:MAG: bifunctional metallophosphatase/5'-nucleotidase [Acidimicrobiia bacterium]|nr:bifunctional metallophosphatase/5'-nucleotidase [Acidimicrobiia bacterium]
MTDRSAIGESLAAVATVILSSTVVAPKTGAPRIAAVMVSVVFVAGALSLSAARTIGVEPARTITLSIVGTNDVHGFVLPANGRGGVAWLGGYLRNLRAVRTEPDGGVIVLDAGDTFQGGIESNLSEGGLVIDAYNALGYAATAIGNHEFDFGPLDTLDPADAPDPRGALKAMAARARFPMLAANLLDAATGQMVDWPNVAPSTLITVAGLRIGIIGAMTIDGLRATLAANVHGLALAPLAETIQAEANRLRQRDADLVLLTIHAGGSCSQLADDTDLSSCDGGSEVFRLLRDLRRGTLDAVVAGHTHAVLAHVFEGVPVIESWWGGRAFGRMDLTVDRQTKRVQGVRLFPPQDLCVRWDCAASPDDPGTQRMYEGRPVAVDPDIVRAMAPALDRVRQMQAEPLPVTVDTLVRRGVDSGAPLGNLFADAMRESVSGADLSVNNNGFAGLRADLPAGPLTFGRLYDVFPFDNRLVQLTMTGTELERVFAEEIRRQRPGALAVSGVRVRGNCEGPELRVRITRSSGEAIDGETRVQVVTSDMLAGGVVFAAVAPRPFPVPATAPIVRTLVERWLRRRGGRISEEQFLDRGGSRWTYPTGTCAAQ